jgi:hypothetical protein
MRPNGAYLRRPLRADDAGAAASVGTVLLVVLVVAMVSVVGLYVFTIVRMPEEPPDIKVSFYNLNNRWSASITHSREPVPLEQLRLIVRTDESDYATYDSDGDGVRDEVLVGKASEMAVVSGDGPQMTPLVFVDADGDDRLTVGDSIVAYEFYYFPSGPLMDADRGYAFVGPNPDGIPRNSTLQVVASPLTLGNPDINFGDTVRVEIWRGATPVDFIEGAASGSGTFSGQWEVPIGVPTGSYDARFIIRPGEMDEWTQTRSFRVYFEAPITPAEEAIYYNTTHPFKVGYNVQLVHIPSNSVALDFEL